MDFATSVATEACPIALQHIKALFVQEQYRKCIQVCRDTLNLLGSSAQNPLLQTYISLYLALSYDAIARVMHHNSVAKLPAFHSAEQHLHEALGALPSPEQARELCTRVPRLPQSDPFVEERRQRYSIHSQISDFHLDDRTPSRASSIWLSSPPQLDGQHIPSSPTQTASDLDDAMSHASCDLATPKGLPRHYSRMSLLDSSPLDKQRSIASAGSLPVQRQKSVRGLMRPIQPGSPVRTFHIPPTLPYSRSDVRGRSMLPRLSTSEQMSAHPASSYLAYARLQADDIRSPVSPVSPISRTGSEHDSEETPVSPVSPQTPDHHPPYQRPTYQQQPCKHPAYQQPYQQPSQGPSQQATCREAIDSCSMGREEAEAGLDEAAYLRVTDHVNAMRRQIESHLVMLYNCKEQLLTLRKEKKAAAEARKMGIVPGSTARDSGTYLLGSPVPSRDRSAEKKMPHARSYWSFVPEDVQVEEKQRYIEAGRARKWEKKRFDPRKYRDLCEKALAEL